MEIVLAKLHIYTMALLKRTLSILAPNGGEAENFTMLMNQWH